MGLTPKQLKILEWIEVFQREKGYMPSRREIASGLGLSSPATIQEHVQALEEKGYLKRKSGQTARAFEATRKAKETLKNNQHSVMTLEQARHGHRSSEMSRTAQGGDFQSNPQSDFEIPILGSIAAGYPIEVFPVEQRLPLSFGFLGLDSKLISDVYALRVRGDSMIDDGIFQDDLVVLKRTTSPRTGQTVAALLNGEATLKRWDARTRTLHPANPKYPVISIQDEDRFEIQGVLIGLIRKYD